MKTESYKNNKLSVVAVDLFCGVGGLTYGLNKSGIKVVAGVDVDERCKFAFEKNNGGLFINKSIKGVVEREEAQIGVFITLQKPTKPMQKEALSAGFYESPSGKLYPKIQILKIEDLINGNKNIERPPKEASNDVTFKKAKRHIYAKDKQGELL